MQDVRQTIVALASAPSGGPRGIVRASGEEVAACFSPWLDGDSWQQAQHPSAYQVAFRLDDHRRLPGHLCYWPTPRSYTRQPSIEFHTLGSPPLLQRILRQLCQSGARLAEPGEFTLRAFLAGRMDLVQAEAVLGVIDADNRTELDLALTQLAGGLTGPLEKLRQDLLELLADIEAGLDFVEDDIEFVSEDAVARHLSDAIDTIDALLEKMKNRGNLSPVPRVALWGMPNAGKSCLFNALCGRNASIVTPLAGTTRDVVVRRIQLDGVDAEIQDTAGKEFPGSAMHNHAQLRMRQATDAAHVRVLCCDAEHYSSTQDLAAHIASMLPTPDPARDIVALTKVDRCESRELPSHPRLATCGVSAFTLEGLDEFREVLGHKLATDASQSGELLATTAARCEIQLLACRTHLLEAAGAHDHAWGEELVAAELRLALDALGQVAGVVYTDDLLDVVFRRFCIGK